jgi:tetratricopeptide (TPR) repeat protein
MILALGVAASVSAQSDPLDQVQSLIAAGDRTAARAELDSLLALPDALGGTSRPEAEFLRTVLEESGPDYEQQLHRLLGQEMAPNREAWVRLALGQIAFIRGDLSFALKEFQRAREKGRYEEGSLWEGLTAFALGHGEEARTALERVQDSGNKTIRDRALVALGDTYRAAENWEEARDKYRRVREEGGVESGWWATAVFRESECLQELGEEEESNGLLRVLIAAMPQAYEIPRARARLGVTGTDGTEGEAEPEEPDGEPGTTVFAVQVGAFSQGENAEALAIQVREQGFADVRVTESDDGLFRVLLGRFTERGGAESLGDSLGAELGLGFSVVREN